MKKLICMLLVLCLCVGLTACGGEPAPESQGMSLWTALMILLALGLLAVAGLRTWSLILYNRKRKRNPRRKKPAHMDPVTIILYAVAAVLLLVSLLTSCGAEPSTPTEENPTPGVSTEEPGPSGETTEPSAGTTEPSGETTEPTAGPVLTQFTAYKTESSDPMNWGIHWEILVDGQEVESYVREEPISFGDASEYFALPGVGAFRGNNYRNSATYGTADVTQQTISKVWSYGTDSASITGWSGCGWTGQPLIVQWDAETRNMMNLYQDKKAKEDLVEVIYATLDGHIYFMDLEDGQATRDPIYVGMCFKGAGSLDPRGYPILYVGAGDASYTGKQPRFYIISLLSGEILYEYGNDDPLSIRRDNGDWCAFDSSPLVDAETDTLIWPGENGILYTVKLNTQCNMETGKLSVDPETPVVTRYMTNRNNEDTYWYGYEASVDVVDGYLYVSENGGMFYCVDLNTMELVWAQDTKDDSNASPVFEPDGENGGYVYTAPSLHWTKDENSAGTISLYKLNAVTGEIVWEKPYDVYTVDGVSGGVQSSPLLGQTGTTMEGLVFYSISRAPTMWSGILVALDTETGEEVWRASLDDYAWSSPVAVYDGDGTGYVVICDFSGTAYFLDGATGQVLDKLELGGRVEASPAVYGDMLVVAPGIWRSAESRSNKHCRGASLGDAPRRFFREFFNRLTGNTCRCTISLSKIIRRL